MKTIDYSIVLTIHNKDFLLPRSLQSLVDLTAGSYEIIFVLDGCSDKSAKIVGRYARQFKNTQIIYTPDVFETRANNAGLKLARGRYSIIVQDDMVINEYAWNERLVAPFGKVRNVFAVSGQCSHNWIINPNSKHVHDKEIRDDCWCDILLDVDHANRGQFPRNQFKIRNTCNRGPLALDSGKLKLLDYFDEQFAPGDMDDHDLCYSALKCGWISGCYWIDIICDLSWGGRRQNGVTEKWFLKKANQKNHRIMLKKHRDVLQSIRKKETVII